MKWSWTLGRVAGIELRVHATFLILLAWMALLYGRDTGTVAGAVTGVVFTIAVFASVVLHELGHALTARRFGVATRDITLLPIGGVARLESIPEEPMQELAVALAGPGVTLGVALVTYALMRAVGIPASPPVTGLRTVAGFVAELMWVNVTLLVFNLLPAFPMDGGRVLRALLALRMNYLRATEIAARAGRAFALLFGMLGLIFNPFLVLIALFVWLGAAAESTEQEMHTSLAGVDVARVMSRGVRTLSPGDTLDAALQHVLSGFQHDFPVIDDGHVVGVLSHRALLAGLAAHGRDSAVAESMDRAFRSAAPGEPLEDAVARLRESHCHAMPVMSDGELRGVLTLDGVGEFVAIAAALRQSAAHAA